MEEKFDYIKRENKEWEDEIKRFCANIKDVMCIECKGFEFEVGSGNYCTVIRCKKCGWEDIIHEG